jgi:hypothetical protein
MKVQKKTSVAMIMNMVLLSLLVLAPGVNGQDGARRAIARTGVFRLAGQTLRLTINGQAGNDKLNVTFRRMYYVGSTNGGIWRAMLASQDTTASLAVGEKEVEGIDVTNGTWDAVGIEAIIRGYTGNTTVSAGTVQIINSDGSVAAFFNIFPESF